MIAADLACHPETPSAAVRAVVVTLDAGAGMAGGADRAGRADRAGGVSADGPWRLCWRVVAAARLIVPDPAPPLRTDGLWRMTCMEVFVRPAGQQGYMEVNLSPSGAWAAYRFDAPRAGMRDLDCPPPRIAARFDGDDFVLEAELAPPPGDGPFDIALSCVIVEQGGITSYWALAHPPGRPDFHHPCCFARRLPPAMPA
ncbi:hypothetical protein GVO57_12365 [Sphingomonas changnyeongensis]|uniref:DOMON-like domain-containing protein n=1 Tax=Sphingomonas changnyeongensis TaxID=2698679 RepID=A0A7Z2S8I5_9SPHN|nr:DOMON-like domain-containing protein [Sphingomonas changnyeongensis]QHL91456.1 hypothetical protein GVO57_12365 [Sphingomonas changnyeongensis]